MTLKQKIDEKAREFEKMYDGILHSEIVAGGVEWYKKALSAVAVEMLEEVKGEIKEMQRPPMFDTQYESQNTHYNQALFGVLSKLEALKKELQ